jgi:hypothetical protein
VPHAIEGVVNVTTGGVHFRAAGDEKKRKKKKRKETNANNDTTTSRACSVATLAFFSFLFALSRLLSLLCSLRGVTITA